MKTEFELCLFKTPHNEYKSEVLSAFELMWDDQDNPLPSEWYNFWNGDAGKEIPWGTKVKVTLEVLE